MNSSQQSNQSRSNGDQELQPAGCPGQKLFIYIFPPTQGEKRDHRQQNRNDIVSHACSPVEEERRLEVLLKLNTMK